MAAALLRGGSGLCVRCIHRELCRVVWRPQAALFSSKPSDRKQQRRTHIKKAKPQPAIDIAKLLEQLFSQQRPSTAPHAARPVKATPMAPKPPSTSTSNVPPLSKTEPAASVFAAASSSASTLNAASASPVNPKTSYSSETPQQSPLASADGVSNVTVPPPSTKPASVGPQTAAVETIETSAETATAQPLSAATVVLSVETTTESPVEPFISPMETLKDGAAVAEGPVEPIVEVQTKGTDVGLAAAREESSIEATIELPVETIETRAAVVEGPVEPAVDVAVDIAAETKSSGVVAAKEEPLIETTIETPVEDNTSPLETLQSRAAVADIRVEATVDATLDTPAQVVETNNTDSGPVKVEHLEETAVEPSVEASTSPLETLENRDVVAGGSVETTIETKAVEAAQTEEITTTDSGPVNLSHIVEEETLVETTIEPSVEASMSPLASLPNRDAVAEGSVETTVEIKADTTAQEVETNSSDSGVVNVSSSIIEEPLIETRIESETVEASISPLESRTDVYESVDSLPHTPLIQNVQEKEVESTVESCSGSVPVEEGVNVSEKMTLEFITLHGVEVQVGSLKADELLQTKSSLDEQIERQLQELLVQTERGAEYKAAAETENSSEEESDILTKALSNWDSLSEDLQELEGESGLLVNDLLDVTAVLSKTPATIETHHSEESLQMEEKGGEEEAMTLESITLSDVTAEVEGLESEVLLETRNALDKEVLVKEEQVEVEMTTEDFALLEDATEAELLAVDSISEATDAIEAETSVVLEAMFGSEQGPRQPLDALPVKQQDEVIHQEAEKESGEQEGSVLEAMTLESVTLAEVEASLGSLENESLSEATDYLEKEAESLAGETRTEVEDEVVSEEKAEELKIESLSLPEDDALSELQTDALMEELLFSVPGHMMREGEGPIGQEANVSNAAVATGSVDDDSAAALTGDFTESPALEEVQLEQEVEEEGAQTETLGNEYDLDPVQRLFLEKIREYNNMRGINGEPLEAEPDYEKRLSQETAKLQRLYGGGDLSSFPEFTFTEPEMDQDSK